MRSHFPVPSVSGSMQGAAHGSTWFAGFEESVFHYRAYELNLASSFEIPCLRAVEPGPGVDVEILAVESMPGTPDAAPQESWWQASSADFRMEIAQVALYRVEGGRRIEVLPFGGADPGSVRLFLLGSAMGALLYQRGLFPLHGCAVETPWGAMVFSGPSGIGKSTLAAQFHEAGYRLLSDDVCAIRQRPDGSRLQVLPAVPHLRLRADAARRLQSDGPLPPPSTSDPDKHVLPLGKGLATVAVPLGAIHLLEDQDGADPSLVPIEGFRRLQALADNLYRPAFAQGMGAQGPALRLAGTIAQAAEVFRLSRRRDADCLDSLVRWLEHGWKTRLPVIWTPEP